MRLRDYYRGLPLRLRSALPPDEVAARINQAAASPLRSLATGVLGHAGAGRVALRYRPSFFSYKGMPMLTGEIIAHRGGSRLQLRYRGRPATRAIFPLTYAAMAVMAGVFALYGKWAPGIGPGQKVLLIGLLVLFTNLPLAIHVIAIRNGEAHLAKLAAFLRTTLSATDAEPE